jgi:uncharacterized protein YdbL (DUF1318 family)
MTPLSFKPAFSLSRRRLLAALPLAAAALAAFAAPVVAQSLDEFRKQGVVGERYDGLAVVRQSNPAAQAMVDQVNARRSRIYAERAAQQKVPAAQVGKIYAREIFGRAPAGTWFLGEDGRWVQK